MIPRVGAWSVFDLPCFSALDVPSFSPVNIPSLPLIVIFTNSVCPLSSFIFRVLISDSSIPRLKKNSFISSPLITGVSSNS